MPYIAPSILSANQLDLKREVRLLADLDNPPQWFHIDVMDGHVVPNLTIGPPCVRALKAATNIPLDVHLMIDNPAEQIGWYIDAGADLMCVHVESESARLDGSPLAPGTSYTTDRLSASQIAMLLMTIDTIHDAGLKAGLAVNPDTPVALVESFLSSLDLVLVMSVHPGFGGQSFIENSLDKVAWLARRRSELGLDFIIEIDGGVNVQTAPRIAHAGADLLVAGSAVYGADDPVRAFGELSQAVAGKAA
ncbi:MAG: ribulose-phosphate 3-epimerase [Coriobacteriales bacterium]|jgi:ribulose-phosphate 3-epimerase|nr:ribulose-phosphate 3-epimerase [Coriobacteriales bacterium]